MTTTYVPTLAPTLAELVDRLARLVAGDGRP